MGATGKLATVFEPLNSSTEPTYCALMQATLAEHKTPRVNGQASFKKVGECLYRYPATGAYYALVKRNGKQFRRSLKTADRQLAERKLADFRLKIGKLTLHLQPIVMRLQKWVTTAFRHASSDNTGRQSAFAPTPILGAIDS
jgi:hypothetical protein